MSVNRARGEELRAEVDGGHALGAGHLDTLTNVPDIEDVTIMAELLRRLGCEVAQAGRRSVTIDRPRAT